LCCPLSHGPLYDKELLSDRGLSSNRLERAVTLGLKLHPEIFPANNGRQDDGSLVKLTQSIQRMEKEEIKDDGVAQHMGKFVHHVEVYSWRHPVH